MTRLTLLLGMLVPLPCFGADPMVVDLFVPKTDGFASIRIPSVIVTKKGTVLAFAEGRAADADQAKNKIVLKRSTDGGKTWGRIAVIAEDGDRALNMPAAGFEIAGGDGMFRPADVEIGKDAVKLTSKLITEPVSARYGWQPISSGNLTNGESFQLRHF